MLTRRLTLAVIATVFAASSSLAMLQNADPAAAHPHEHWRHHHQRFDGDDRRHERQVSFGSWHRHHRHANPSYANRAYVNNGYVYNGYNGYGYTGYNGNVYNGYVNPVYYVPGYVNTATYYAPQYQPHRYAHRSSSPHYAWIRPHHDRDDRHWRAGDHNGWNNANNPHYPGYRGHGKPHIDPWRDHDHGHHR